MSKRPPSPRRRTRARDGARSRRADGPRSKGRTGHAEGRGRWQGRGRPAAHVTSTHCASAPCSGGRTCRRAETLCCNRARARAGRAAAMASPQRWGRARSRLSGPGPCAGPVWIVRQDRAPGPCAGAWTGSLICPLWRGLTASFGAELTEVFLRRYFPMPQQRALVSCFDGKWKIWWGNVTSLCCIVYAWKRNLNVVYYLAITWLCFRWVRSVDQGFLFGDTALEQREQKTQLKGIWIARDPNHLGKRTA